MSFTFILYLFTFFAYPIIALLASLYIDFYRFRKVIYAAIAILLTHHLFYFLDGISLKGDDADYIIYSLDYLLFILFLLVHFNNTTSFFKAFRIFGIFIVLLGYLQLFFAVFLLPVFSQDFEADMIFLTESGKNTYETRRYRFGFATLDDVNYTFETYKTYSFLPFEKLINRTQLSLMKNDLNLDHPDFEVIIKEDENLIEFRSQEKYYQTPLH